MRSMWFEASASMVSLQRPDRAHGDDLDRRVHGLHGHGELGVLLDVVGERHVAELPVAVHLVADGPELDAPRLGMAVGRPELAHRRVGRAVGVLELLEGHGDVAQAAVDRDVGLGADEPHQVHDTRGCRRRCARRPSRPGSCAAAAGRGRRCRRASRSR